MSEDINLLSHPARVRLGSADHNEKMRGLVLERGMLDESIVNEFPPFYFRAEISNDLLDSHFTRMDETTLRNYTADANVGVAFLRGHNWKELPIGYSLQAQYGVEGGKQRVIADFYTVSGLPDTNDLIARMKTGLVRDVSVGFHGGSATCDICGNDLFECRHYPGLKYETKEGDTVKTQTATFTIHDARLSEVSGVYDGSTPEAGILKAERAIKDGTLTPQEHDLLQQRYRINLPPVRTVTAVPEIPQKTVNSKKEEKMEELTRFTQLLVNAGVVNESERATLDQDTVLVHFDKLVQRVQVLEPLANDGKQYRADLVSEALTEGVRAFGNDFDKAAYEPMLVGSPIALIKRMRDDWKQVAAKTVPTGRHSVDEDESEVGNKTKTIGNHIPASAYR